jgi:hypothetical protein
MRRDRLIAILCALAAVPLGVALMAAPLLFPTLPRLALASLFYGGILSAVVLIGAAVVLALRDQEGADNTREPNKLIPIVGMAVCLLGLLGFASWYFWPKPIISDIAAAKPGLHMAINKVTFDYPHGPTEFHIDFRLWNDGAPSIIKNFSLSVAKDGHTILEGLAPRVTWPPYRPVPALPGQLGLAPGENLSQTPLESGGERPLHFTFTLAGRNAKAELGQPGSIFRFVGYDVQGRQVAATYQIPPEVGLAAEPLTRAPSKSTSAAPQPAAPFEPALSSTVKAPKLVLECHDGFMPEVPLTANDRAYIVYLPSSSAARAVMAENFLLKGGILNMSAPGKAPLSASTCLIINYSDSVLLDVNISVHVKSWKAVKVDGTTTKIGDIDFENDSVITVPRIDTSRPYGFLFYVINLGNGYQELTFSKTADATNLDTNEQQTVDIAPTVPVLIAWPQSNN